MMCGTMSSLVMMMLHNMVPVVGRRPVMGRVMSLSH